MVVLVSISSILASLERLANRGVPENIPLPVMLGMIAVLGPVFGVLFWYLHAWAASIVAAWLGGRGERADIRAAMAIGALPSIVGRSMIVIPLLVFGLEWFSKGFAAPPGNAAWLWTLAGVQTALAIYAIVLMSKGMGEACGFSAWRGWASLAIPYAVLIAAAAAVVLPIILLSRR